MSVFLSEELNIDPTFTGGVLESAQLKGLRRKGSSGFNLSGFLVCTCEAQCQMLKYNSLQNKDVHTLSYFVYWATILHRSMRENQKQIEGRKEEGGCMFLGVLFLCFLIPDVWEDLHLLSDWVFWCNWKSFLMARHMFSICWTLLLQRMIVKGLPLTACVRPDSYWH